ncbi:MAG: WGR domain-containing protein [Methylobacter sp.]|nr:WGR domain-containing protein [Methylobacter sp.]MDP3362741.1 WGR domain-containing protein [Methylobacter sp.]
MNNIYLEHHDPDKNMHRFYQMYVTPGIFGDWSLVKEWGRKGSPGTVRMQWFGSEEDAREAGQKLRDAKQKKGYQLMCPTN